MKDLGLQPISKTSSSLSDEDVFLEYGNFNLEETNAGFSGEIKQSSKTIKHVSTFNGWLIRS